MYPEPAVEGKIARDFPENLIFCRDEVLFQCAVESDDDLVRAQCTAELFVRAFFSGKSSYREKLDSLLPDREFSCFSSRILVHKNLHEHYLDQPLWIPSNDFSGRCLAAVGRRFRLLAKAAGLIPVYAKGCDDGFLIPFDLQVSDSPKVEDLDSLCVEDWSAHLARLGIKAHVRLHCHSQCGPGGRPFQFVESSMMLPVWCAWLRSTGVDLPRYNPFRIVFSGSFDGRDVLAPVMTTQKAAAVANAFGDAIFVIPESPGQNAVGYNIRQIPCLPRSRCLPNIQDIVDSLEKTTFQYAMGRIRTLCDKVQLSQYDEWASLVTALENNDVFDEDENPEEFLLNLMLRSEACCHCGRTDKAAAINARAQEYAVKRGTRFEKQLYRLQIEMLVILVDKEDFERIQTLTPDLEKRLFELNDPDLLMRFHGTMGQILSYGTLCRLPGFSKEEALRHFELAKNKAFELGTLQDKRQDLNYLHLWHALFAPGSQKERDAFERAQKMLDREEDENYTRNYWYLTRQKTFAAYRAMLAGHPGEFSCLDHLLDFDPRRKISWTQALSCKYAGAVLAANGQMQDAKNCFETALALSPDLTEPILRLIRMTILAEAWRSLGAAHYKEQALTALGALQEQYPRQYEKWRGFLLGTDPFPGLDFWY